MNPTWKVPEIFDEQFPGKQKGRSQTRGRTEGREGKQDGQWRQTTQGEGEAGER